MTAKSTFETCFTVFTGPSRFEFPVAERGERWGASREELTERGSRKVSVLPCAKDFGECACFVDTTDLDMVKELGSSGGRFL